MIQLLLVFLLAVLTGGMLVHLLWPERDIKSLSFKIFLGIGIGLGFWSLLYFLYLLLFAGEHWFLVIQVVVFLTLAGFIFSREKTHLQFSLPHWSLSRTMSLLLGISLLVFAISLLSTASYLLRRKQGDWDAWMMYNRAARFFYRDPANWLESFSRQMDPMFHADYPLLLAMNVSSGWDTLGTETPRVPMVQSALFAVGCAGLLFSSLATVKSIGQASLGLIILWGTPVLVNEGAREMADLPLAYFFLATFILIYLFIQHQKPGLMALAGLTAGMAAWTKNEGSLFVVATSLALALLFLRKKNWPALRWYGAGLAIPLAIVLYFKLFLAPPSDVLSNGLARSIQQILETSRYLEITQFFGNEFLTFGNWSIPGLTLGIIPILLIYLLLFRESLARDQLTVVVVGMIILVIQELGNYAVYLITPYDLTWHLEYSIERIFLQVFPLLTFLILCVCRNPESIFESKPENRIGASHVTDH